MIFFIKSSYAHFVYMKNVIRHKEIIFNKKNNIFFF